MHNLHLAVQGQLRRVPDLERIAARLHRTHAQPGRPVPPKIRDKTPKLPKNHEDVDTLRTIFVSTWFVAVLW